MKTAILTGASSGIGSEILNVLLENNIKVFGIGRDFSNLDINSKLFIPIICDMSKPYELSDKISFIKKENSIDILINNAGIGYFAPHEQLNTKKIHEMVSVNLEAPLIITQLLLRDLKKNNGIIINISSITAKKSNTYGCAYGATKAGLTSFANSLFDEVRKYNVKVITIHPDMTKSRFYENADFTTSDNENSYIYPIEIAKCVKWILEQRKDIVITDITIRPQKHNLKKKL